MGKLVSIIIPAYNYGIYLEECVNSIINQEYEEWEAIIVDDGSTDHTSDVCYQLMQQDKRVKYIRQLNQGQPAARNTGLALANGSFIQFLDADDIIQPKKLQSQVCFLEANTTIDITFSNVLYFKSTEPATNELFLNRWDDPQKAWITRIEGNGEKLVNAYARKNLFELGCALFRRNVINKVGPFDIRLKGVEDYDYCWRAAICGFQFSYSHEKEAGILMRHHESSFSKNIRQMHQAEINLRHKMTTQLKHNGFKDSSIVNKKQIVTRLRKWQYLVIAEFRTAKSKPTAKDLFWYTAKTNPVKSAILVAKLIKNLPMYIAKSAKASSHPKPRKNYSYFPAENDF